MPGIHGMNKPTRCIVACGGENDCSQFLAATCSLREQNEIHLIQLEEDQEEVRRTCIYQHPNEVWSMACKNDILITCSHSLEGEYRTSCYRLEQPESGQISVPLRELACVETGNMLSHPFFSALSPNRFATVTESRLQLWTLGDGRCTRVVQTPKRTGYQKLAGSWDPLHAHAIVVSRGQDLVLWDTRGPPKEAFVKTQAHHGSPVTCLDFAPLTQYRLASAASDGSIKLWDTRNTGEELGMVQEAHSHWVESIAFNPKYNALLLTASTDYCVKMWRADLIVDRRMVSAAAPASHTTHHQGVRAAPPELPFCAEIFRDHQDSVHSVCWSHSDNDWAAFSSASHDGWIVAQRASAFDLCEISE